MPDDGGPAFPRPYSTSINGNIQMWEQDGMSLRDYFAAQVLPEVYKEVGTWSLNHTRSQGYDTWAEAVAHLAYEAADEMIRARSLEHDHSKPGT